MPLSSQIQKVIPGGAGTMLNYNYVDIAAGTGYVEYYLGGIYNNGVSGGILTDQAFYAEPITFFRWGTLSGAIGGVVQFKKVVDKDFDVEFKKSQTLRGDAIINIPAGIKNKENTYTSNSFVNVRIRKVVNGVESEIASSSSAILTGPALVNTYVYAEHCIKCAIPQTRISQGEKLRVTTELWAGGANADPERTMICFIGADPKNRATLTGDEITFGTEPSIATIKIPFKLDI